MNYYVVNRRTGETEGEAVDIGRTLYIHLYKSSLSYSYPFGKWPKKFKYIKKER